MEIGKNISKSIIRSTSIRLHSSIVAGSGNYYYVAPNGSDTDPGTAEEPFATLSKAWSVVIAGDTIYMRGGTYTINSQQLLINKSGTALNKIRILNYPGESPKIVKGTISSWWTDVRTGIHFYKSNHIEMKGIEIYGFPQEESQHFYYGIVAQNCQNIRFERLNVHHNGFGLVIGDNPDTNLSDNVYVVNCDLHHNSDPLTLFSTNTPYGGADGLRIGTSNPFANIYVQGCRMYRNSDDGVDTFNCDSNIFFSNTWIWKNGYIPGVTINDPDTETTFSDTEDGIGFKLGPALTDLRNVVKKTLTNCLSVYNKGAGFDQNYNPGMGTNAIAIYNSIAYACSRGFSFRYYDGSSVLVDCPHIVKNNISYANTYITSPMGQFTAASTVANNTFMKSNPPLYWNTAYNEDQLGVGFTLSNEYFESTDYNLLETDRLADGSLPDTAFMKTALGSPLIDQGTDVGLPYNNNAPDIGCFEYSGTIPNQAPIIVNSTFGVNDGITNIGAILATDLENDTLTFEITGGADQSLVSIDTNTGELTFNSAHYYSDFGDDDQDNVYTIEVTVTDSNGGTDTQVISITLINQNTLIDGLVSYWKFDETSGTSIIDSMVTGGNNLTATGVTINQTPIIGAGKSIAFDGSTSHLSCPDKDNLDLTSPFTLSAWIEPTVVNSNHVIMAKGNLESIQNGFVWYIFEGSMHIDIATGGATVDRALGGTILNDGTKYHVMFVNTGTAWISYVNGVQTANISMTYSPSANTNSLFIGENENNLYGFTGKIDEVAIWNRVVTSTENTTIYNGGAGKVFPFI